MTHQHFVDVCQHRRQGIDLFDDRRHLASQHRIHLVEVVVERGQERSRRHRLGGDAEVEIDVRVHPGQHVLHDDGIGTLSAVEGHPPAFGEERELCRMKIR